MKHGAPCDDCLLSEPAQTFPRARKNQSYPKNIFFSALTCAVLLLFFFCLLRPMSERVTTIFMGGKEKWLGKTWSDSCPPVWRRWHECRSRRSRVPQV